MLSDVYLYCMKSNRAQEKTLYAYENVYVENSQVYISIHDDLLGVRIFQSLMTRFIKVSFFFLLTILQLCDFHGLKKQTKYRIKKSFDTYVLKFPNQASHKITFVAIILFRMALKENQDPQIYDRQVSEQYCMQYVDCRYSIQDFRKTELQLYQQPEFNMVFTTPYDYLGLIAKIFFLNAKDYNKILRLLDFSYTVEKLMFNTAEEILFGCLLLAFQQNTNLKSWIISQSFSKQESEKACQLIKFQLQSQLAADENDQFQ